MSQFNLTSSQREAIGRFKEFLKGDSQVFMLKGAAGTGKTTIVSEFIKILDNTQRKVSLMAPTGRAAYILGKKTGKEARTIHRGIYSLSSISSKSSYSEDSSGVLHSNFSLKANDTPLTTIYIVDEASMISDIPSSNEIFSFGSGQVLTDLFDYINGRKIIFVGDYAQLPPVGMETSPALDKDYIESHFGSAVEEVMLREVVRQQTGSVMLVNANKIRDAIESQTFFEFKLQDGDDSMIEPFNLLRPYFNLSDSKPDPHSAIITFSNKQALQYNLAIRSHYFGQNPERLRPGDLLMIARNNYAFEEELFNGNIVFVESCAPDSDVEYRNVRVALGNGRVENVDLSFRKAVLKFKGVDSIVSINVRLLDNFLDDPSGTLSRKVYQALIVDFDNRLPKEIKDELPLIRRMLRRSDNYTDEQNEKLVTYITRLRNDPYYNAVICKYGYALTCHKAQGGEWDNVFVDMFRYGNTANENYFRWAYTALTRASKQLWHYMSPDFSYISNICVEAIQSSNSVKISTYSAGGDFLKERFERICQLVDRAGLTVKEDKNNDYQHRLTFNDNDGERADFILWYNNNGYSSIELQRSTSDEFTALCKGIIEDSYAPSEVPFSSDREFAEKFIDFVRALLVELDIKLHNIVTGQYQDTLHVKADGAAYIILCYNSRGRYTHMRLVSSMGQDDRKLTAFRERFI